jgi:ubiquinone/menaquinone biosynthesis C-methylase UbiE|tara:strand:- start:642 stop:1460 length:819 start_codon:yes stop_codon:yes gene_type:complete
LTTDDFSFSTFSKNEFYDALNARLVDMTDLGSGQRIVDLACGTGGVTRLILERIKGARDSAIIAMDHSAIALKQAMEDLKDIRDNAVQFVQSQVEQVSESLKERADTIIFCNAIHYVPDKDALVGEISKALKPGGKFAFNTSFFDGGQPENSLQFYRKWMFKAARDLRKEYGLKPERSKKVESRKHLTPDDYKDLVERHGFTILKQKIETIDVPIGGWLDISTFEDFISGTMPGVPLEQASASLQRGIEQAFEELNLTYVQRNWLGVVAVRT